MTYFTDRSRIIQHQRCPRSRYWRYEWNGIGLSSTRSSIPLVVGGAVHKGLEELLNGHDIERAVQASLCEFDERCGTEGGFALQPNENALYVVREQRALTEALVRVFAIRGLPELLSRYDVLEVEREDTLELAPGIVLMARADGLLRDKQTDDLYILSFKTASYYDKRTERQGDHDVQGLSEMAAIEARLAIEHPARMCDGCAIYGEAPHNHFVPRISGTQMIYLIKGNRSEYPQGCGLWTQNSPLVRPWKSTGVTRGGDRYAWSYQWVDGSGSTRRLGKDWRRVNIWEEMEVDEWVKALNDGYIQSEAGDPLASICLILPVNYRRDAEMRDWLEQVRAQEINLAFEAQNLDMDLNVVFPQYRHSCDYPSACDYINLCYGPPQIAEDPLSTGLYKIRTAHHLPEIKQHEPELKQQTEKDESL